MSGNYSIYAIPVYWALALFPHVYAITTIRKNNNNKFDNANPRSVNTIEQYKKAIPGDCFARYEKGEAAHKNMLENAPLFIGAVVVGNIAKLDASTLNLAVGAYIGLRTLYIWQYINITKQSYSRLRSVNWAISTGLLFWVFVKAGNALF